MYLILDTNVIVVANGNSAQASAQCVIECNRILREIQDGQHILVLDNACRILREYRNNLNLSEEYRPGDRFLKWLLRNLYNPQHCVQVALPLRENATDDNDFAAFPADPRLAKFDLSDRKFVAVALTHPAKPPIYNAVDTDWHDFQEVLELDGLKIAFLCRSEMAQHSG